MGLANLSCLRPILQLRSVMKSARKFGKEFRVIQKNCRLTPHQQIDITLASLETTLRWLGV